MQKCADLLQQRRLEVALTFNNTCAMLDHANKFDDEDAVGDETEEEEVAENDDEDEEPDMELGYDDATE